MIQSGIPILGFVARSNTGKTTLLVRILPLLTDRGWRVAVVKHAPHGFDIDRPGKDSFKLRQAGATQTLIGSQKQWVLMTEVSSPPGLDELLRHIDQDHIDCVLVEGFKHESFPKIELYRPALGHPLLCTDDASIVAVASDGPLPVDPKLPILDLNKPDEVADFVAAHLFGSQLEAAQDSK